MRHYTLLLVFLLFYMQMNAQITFDISEFEFGQDSIVSMSVGDPDNNLKDDIFITVADKNLVYKLQNGTNGFTKTIYLSKDEPELFRIVSLNGGDDIVYTEKGKSDIHLMYGKDDYYVEKRYWGALELDSSVLLKSIGSVNPEEYIYSNILLYGVDQNNTFQIYRVSASSFNSIAPYFQNSVPLDFSPGKSCGYYFDNRVSRIFIPDQSNGKLKALVKNWNIDPNIPIDKNMEIIDSKLEKPVACMTVFSKEKDDVLLLLDASSSAVYKYYINENYRREEFILELDNPSQIAAGLIDNNDLIDLLILDGNKLWLVTDVHESRLGVSQTLLIEEAAPLKNLSVFDFNKDGFADIIYNLQGGNKIKVLKNDLISSVTDENQDLWVIKPNPTNAFIRVEGVYDDLSIYDVKGNNVKFSTENNTFVFEEIVKGQYIIKICNRGNCKSKMFLIE
ncbi:MAG: hypothetical protein IPN89_04130 [Saprospiraceae bacterium]|nr:hypothetical protein [Saprospiraceae bacterium]